MNIAIVIPTYNERENISSLIEDVLHASPATIIIVDDASPDGTAEVIESLENDRVILLQRSGKFGLGSAYIHGFDHALRHGFEIIGQMDADYSHHPEDIQDLADAVRDGYLIMGSRYIKGGKIAGWNLWRHFCSRSAITASRLILGIPSKDVTSGFRFWSAELLAKVMGEQIASSGYAFQEEMLYHAHRLGGEVNEYPITFRDRKAGQSKLGKKDVIEFFSMLSRLRKTYGKLS